MLKMSQDDLAEKSGVSQSMISCLELGERNEKFNLNFLQQIALVLGWESLAEFIEFAEAHPPDELIIAEVEKIISQ
jgi:transcriptional regulator with XRE-family HTH domain